MKHKVSIIVPVYNVQDYLLRCLNSLKVQSYNDIEIVIVDDGSKDDSGRICDSFSINEKRARVFHKKNGGLSDARNFGIEKSSGELIAFVDSDDYVDKNYIDKMVRALIKDESDIVVCGYNLEQPKEEIVDGFDAVYYSLVRQENVDIVAWNKLYKKELFTDSGILFPRGEKHEDLLTTYKVMSKAKRVSYISDSLYHYETREGSITNTETIMEKLNMRERAANEAMEYFKNNKELKKVAEVSLLLAKYAYMDVAIRGKIGREYFDDCLNWLQKNKNDINVNNYLTRKLRFYNMLNLKTNGKMYKLFRKIRHE